MLLYLQSRWNPNSYLQVDEIEKATHYQDGDGTHFLSQKIRNELVQNGLVTNPAPDDDFDDDDDGDEATPLEIPEMDFSNAGNKSDYSEQDDEDEVIENNLEVDGDEVTPLPLPEMNFSHKRKSNFSGQADAASDKGSGVRPLPLPVMRF